MMRGQDSSGQISNPAAQHDQDIHDQNTSLFHNNSSPSRRQRRHRNSDPSSRPLWEPCLKIIIVIALGIGCVILSRAYTRLDAVMEAIQKQEQLGGYSTVPLQGNLTLSLPDQAPRVLPYLAPLQHRPHARPEPPLPQLPLHPSPQQHALLLQSSSLGREQFAQLLIAGLLHNNQSIALVQYQHWQSRYQISLSQTERWFCIVSPMRNLKSNQYGHSLELYLRALDAQNYTKYRVAMIDDNSDDGTVEYVLGQLKAYPRLSNRIVVLANRQRVGALGNRDYATRNYCNQGDIVIELDADDAMIGRQVLRLYNRLYELNPDRWFIYTQYIMKKISPKNQFEHYKGTRLGKNQQIRAAIHESNTYRTTFKYWPTVHMRSYLRRLYLKIPLDYLMEQPSSRYYLWASDRFSMYALAELAGPQHTLHVDEAVYFYNLPDDEKRAKVGCDLFYIRAQEMLCRMQVPLRPLGSLEEQARPTEGYVVPQEVSSGAQEKERLYRECVAGVGPQSK